MGARTETARCTFLPPDHTAVIRQGVRAYRDNAISMGSPDGPSKIVVSTQVGCQAGEPVASSSVGATKKPILVKGTDQADDDGFVTVQRKKRRQRTSKNRCGTAPAESNIKIRAAKPNTPVYISRLHYTTKAEDIVEYVRQKLKYAPRVQLLESRHNANFKAFVVRVPTCFLHLVLDENFWPQDVVFRRFRGQVPLERTVT
ncbi:hypothetical protein SFRURICE_014036 [Spodoptera frugiperda]|nr:hypothetical protein SFRURICE_014036 [Spodoptera frugiperda]